MMPYSAPSIRACGCVLTPGERCRHMLAADQERKARHDQHRPTARQRGYDTKWDKARAAYLKAHPSCVMCGAAASVVDHIQPHKGNNALFWKSANWQALCTPCHSSRKQRMERQ